MTDGPKSLFWDSCVFAAFLYDEKAKYDLASIEQYLAEAKAGKFKIYTSSIIFAEIASSKICSPKVGSMGELVRDLVGSVIVIDASVNIMQLSGRLKEIRYRKGKSDKRYLQTGDAIMLATVLHLEDAFGVAVDTFHTFDNAKKKTIPLLSYEQWCEGLTGDALRLAKRVCEIDRKPPIHPTPLLPGTFTK